MDTTTYGAHLALGQRGGNRRADDCGIELIQRHRRRRWPALILSVRQHAGGQQRYFFNGTTVAAGILYKVFAAPSSRNPTSSLDLPAATTTFSLSLPTARRSRDPTHGISRLRISCRCTPRGATTTLDEGIRLAYQAYPAKPVRGANMSLLLLVRHREEWSAASCPL